MQKKPILEIQAVYTNSLCRRLFYARISAYCLVYMGSTA